MEAALSKYRNIAHKDLRESLIVDHLDYVRHLLGRLVVELPSGVDLENLESAGVLGLVEAANQFDPDRGVAFKTFAYNRIRGAMIDELRRNCPVPQQILQRWSKIREVYRVLDPPVSPEDLARHCDLTLDEVLDCLTAMKLTRPERWEAELESDRRRAHHQHDRPDQPLQLKEQHRLMADAIEDLPDQQRVVITMYYHDDMRLKEIGAVLGLSESRISRILSQAEFTVREAVALKW